MKHKNTKHFMKQIFTIIIISILLISCSENHKSTFYAYNNTTTPVILGKGTLSSDAVAWNNVYIPKTKEMFFTKMGDNVSEIMVRLYTDSTFTEAQKINFPDKNSHSDVYVNSAASLMLFSSLMLEHDKDTIADWNIWKSTRKN